ncbi:MAG: prephenate dehydratase [Anaeromassilibacillus sp.]|nr:prephenate dehydratase [Anaeromassilibacillus sp.]MDY3779329.1 prephenate dehydratase [Candidatus Limousia pullorum]
MRDLADIRKEIDGIDKELIELFKKRMDCAKAVGEYKKANNVPILNQKREDEILDEVQKKGGEYGHYARLLYANIMELSRALQHNIVGSGEAMRRTITEAVKVLPEKNLKIACQGIKGANSHEAATEIFPLCQPVFYKKWSDVFAAVDKGEADFGVLPVENSTAGSVSDVYDLILKNRFYIVREKQLKINHCLCGIKQSSLEDIEQVWSHPQALSQCSEFIAENNMKAVPCSNTAVAAKEIFEEKRINCAAICSESAAEEYGLKILKRDFQNSQGNTTRFIVISKKLYIPENADKISLCFSLPHVTGSLYTVLCRFNSSGLNLTKIESRPMPDHKFEYLFYLDFTGNVYNDDVLNLLCALSEELPEFSFLGNYN